MEECGTQKSTFPKIQQSFLITARYRVKGYAGERESAMGHDIQSHKYQPYTLPLEDPYVGTSNKSSYNKRCALRLILQWV